MKILLSSLILALLWLCTPQTSAADVASARESAEKFLLGKHSANKSRSMGPGQPQVRLELSFNDGDVMIFNADKGGFAVVGNNGQIFGYSLTSHFDFESAPTAAQALVEACRQASKKYVAVSSDLPSKIDPLLGETRWHQESPYNLLCPMDEGSGEHCVAGCSPIAMSQIMYYHRYPEHGYGKAFYNWGDKQIGADLTESVYNWAAMKPYYSGAESQDSQLAVAQLVRDAGFALNTNYDLSSSSTANLEPVKALVDHFNYDKSIRRLTQWLFDDEEWYSILFVELAAGRPIFYSAQNGASEGHSLICDGYDADGNLHFNFGWGGNADGYYNPALMQYNKNAEVLINIKPDEGGEVSLDPYCYTDFLYDGTHLNIGFQIQAGGSQNTPYLFAFELTDRSTGKKYNSSVMHSDFAYAWMEMVFDCNTLAIECPDGQYEMRPIVCQGTVDAHSEWRYFHFKQTHQSKVYATFANGLLTSMENTEELHDPIDDGVVCVDNIYFKLDNQTLTAKVVSRNGLRPSYYGDVIIPAQITCEGQSYVVNEIGEKAFEVCRSLKKVFIPKTIEIIAYAAFSRAELYDLEIEEGSCLKRIEEAGLGISCFKDETGGDVNKKILILPEGLQELGNHALGSMNVDDLVVPASVAAIGDMGLSCRAHDIFLNWSQAPEMPYDILTFQRTREGARNMGDCILHVPVGSVASYSATTPWCLYPLDEMNYSEQTINADINGLSYKLRGSAATLCASKDKEYSGVITIPEDVMWNGKKYTVVRVEHAFSGSSVNSVTFPTSVRYMDDFRSCPELQSIIFPENSMLKSFTGAIDCPKLNQVTLPSTLQKIGLESFVKCPGLLSIDLPGSISFMEESFKECSFTDIYAHWLYPPTPLLYGNPNGFFGLVKPLVHVPAESKEHYENSDVWGSFSIVEDSSLKPSVNVDNTNLTAPANENADNYTFDVYNNEGLILSKTISSNPPQQSRAKANTPQAIKVDVSSLSSGNYFYSIRANSHSLGNVYVLEGNIVVPEDFNGIEEIYSPEALIDVYNIQGILIAQSLKYENLHTLSPGIYILKSRTSEGKQRTEKYIIR